ncbi:uncharacterized protein AMSG_01818 [Thecamonas trahens ATCC 50062]|uniref:NAD-dependent epimerase/dehydratase domain-containing protein n=1 Tax=Thecamonas trahens ATCC 50062 TaxID=461836 RepID=A0A0L0DTG6_THETB|nr:hypothetical protein AMSG_01818 [Thecamonas trahens ATCC 50062]KNC55555.1 hypothetical protein AMSG_01818 [Thecamonas trahens ATCC 50062]|eukprot:XP_013761329.1 hypothetical protein AMSG_01818 [Thecamonas trahens ATCC 50062]
MGQGDASNALGAGPARAGTLRAGGGMEARRALAPPHRLVEEDQDVRHSSASKSARRRLDSYGDKKLDAERELRQAAANHGFPFIALRLPDVVGEAEVPSSRHFSMQRAVADGETIGLGMDTHLPLSFVYAPDVARVCVALAGALASRGKAKAKAKAKRKSKSRDGDRLPLIGESFNVGSYERPTLREYVETIAGELGLSKSLKFKHGGPGTHLVFPSVDIGPISMTKLVATLASYGVDYEPTPFPQWMASTVAWYEAHRDEMDSSSSSSSSGSESSSSASGSASSSSSASDSLSSASSST